MLLFKRQHSMHATLHELHRGSMHNVAINTTETLLINEIREKSDILGLLQNCTEP